MALASAPGSARSAAAEHPSAVLQRNMALLQEDSAREQPSAAASPEQVAAKFSAAVEKRAARRPSAPPTPEPPPEEDAAPAPTAAPPPRDKDFVGHLKWQVLEYPENAAKLLRTMLMEDLPAPGASEDEFIEEVDDLPLMQKVAIVLVGLGQETTGDIMKHLSDFENEELTQAIAALKNVPTELMTRVLEEFEQHLLAGEWVNQGGIDFARSALERAVGPRKAQEILDRVITRISSGFYVLKNVPPDQIAPFISHEHPQTIALILSQLDPAQAAGILTQLPKRMQADVAYRIAIMENITPNIIKQIEESLEQSLRDMLGGDQDVGGPKVVADMLNMTGSSVEKNVLDQMDSQDPQVAEAVRNLMFVFEDIAKLSAREIQTLMQEVDQKDLVIALKAASEETKDKFFGNMSEKVRTLLIEEIEFLGPMRLSEVEEIQLRIVQQARQLEEQGQVTIVRGDSDDQFV